ncbi:GNAT family N-acetyltransferase [soil metagenome]
MTGAGARGVELLKGCLNTRHGRTLSGQLTESPQDETRERMKYTSREALDSDVPRIHELVNSAYRGESSKKGWTTEADILGGQRIDPEALRTILADSSKTILCLIETPNKIIGTVCLERFEDERGVGVYLGMLTIEPTAQTAGLGKRLMQACEEFAKRWGGRRITLGVINVRTELMEWYERRGFVKSGLIEPFPYGDARFGEPKRPDLNFVMFEKPI